MTQVKRLVAIRLRESWFGLLLAILIGVLGYGIRQITKTPVADPLLVAMIIGIMFRTIVGDKPILRTGFTMAPRIFIPIGIIFYAINNLNFVKFAQVKLSMIMLMVIIILVYFIVILIMGKFLRQKKEITFLTATGSAICGASAIAITSPAIEADPDDISISLLSVAVAALVGLFIIIPFLATLFNITNKIYGLLSASVLQFTGFVKAAVGGVPFLKQEIPQTQLVSLALSIKAVRYLGLLIAIPLFTSLMKRKIYIPWVLWIFLIAGLCGSWIYKINDIFYDCYLIPYIKPIYRVSWSIAMAAVGLNADIRQLLSNNGTKALIMAFAGFLVATGTFFLGLFILRLL